MRSPEMGLLAGRLLRGEDFNEITHGFKPDSYEIGRAGNVGVLLVHGFTASPTETRPLAEYVGRKHPDWYCKGILLPGHGETVECLEETTRHDWLEAAESAYLEMAKTCTHVFLAGVSMGAVLCCHIAHRHRMDPKLRGLILMAPAFGFTSTTLFGIRLLKPFVRCVKKGARKAGYFAKNRLLSYTEIPLAKMDEVVQLGRESFEQLKDVRNIPTVVFAGSKERTVSLRRIRQARDANPWMEFHELPQSDHIVTVEPDHEKLFEKSMAFMEKHVKNTRAETATPVATIP
jgi:carboxylesterase